LKDPLKRDGEYSPPRLPGRLWEAFDFWVLAFFGGAKDTSQTTIIDRSQAAKKQQQTRES